MGDRSRNRIGASARRALGRRLVRAYPLPWRARYEDEVLALLDEAAVRWRDVADLARGLFIERVRATFEPGDRPILTLVGMELTCWTLTLALGIGTAILGSKAHTWLGPIPLWWGIIVGIAMAATWLAQVLPLTAWAARHPAPAPGEAPPLRWAAPWIGVMLACLVIIDWATWATSGISVPLSTFLVGCGYHVRSALLFRGKWGPLEVAVGKLFQHRHDIKWALLELQRCEILAALGMTAPLDEARANLDRVRKSREETLSSLHAMGYRARFR